MPRTAAKTSLVTFRVTPETKALLVEAATAERRSQANMLEVMVDDWCKGRGISVPSARTDRKHKKKT